MAWIPGPEGWLATISNELFYNGQLRSGCSEIQRLPLVEEIPVVLFCDTYDLGKEVRDHFNSYSNLYEAKLACQLVTHFLKRGVSGSQIGVIVLYKSQACLLQKLLENENEDWQSAGRRNYKALTMKKNKDLVIFNVRTSSIKEVQVSTVDAFQGMEKDIIILSCCRTNGLGFLSSPNRVNVALTRARHHLIIIGKAENLQKSWFWQELLRHVHSIPGAYRSASSLNTDLQRAMEGNENTASHNCEENHIQIQDLNNNPKNSNGLTHVLMPTFSSKCWHGEQNSLIGEKPKKCQKNADITSSYDSLQEVPLHESHMESEDTSTAEASGLQSFDSEAQDTNELILPSCHHDSSWVSEVIRNPGSCYYENCHSQVSSKQNRPEREKSEKEMALQSEVTLQEIPDLPGELHMCSIEMEETLNELSFRAKDFWYGYKLYCIGHYSHSAEHKHQFQECKMGRALSKLYGEDKIWWKASFDEIVRLAWSMMEDYVKRKFGEDCKDIWTLIKTYDNLEELAANEYGSFFLQMTEVESSHIEVSQMMVDRNTDGDCNTVFNELRQQLGKMDNRLQHLEGKGCKQVHSSVDYSIASVQINDKIAASPSAVEDVENELSALAFSGRKDCGQGFSSLLGQVLDGVSDNAPQTQRSNHISKVKCFDTFQEHYIGASDTKPQESDLPATPGWLPNFDLGI